MRFGFTRGSGRKSMSPNSGSTHWISNDPKSIAIGKGSVELANEVVEAAEGKYLVLELNTERGPCPDNMCQLRGFTLRRRT